MKRFFCAILASVLLLSGCAQADPYQNLKDHIAATLDIDLSDCTMLDYRDSHGGFHGDGEIFASFSCPESVIFALQDNACWHALPLSENTARALYGSTEGDTRYGALFADENGDPLVPLVESGCWFFRDRSTQNPDPTDDSGLFSRNSWNFDLAVYDALTQTLYFFTLDT